MFQIVHLKYKLTFLIFFISCFFLALFWPLNSSLSYESNGFDFEILLHVRLVRVLAAALLGASLAAGGVVFQGLFRNPLAESSLLGSSSAAGFMGSLAFALGLAGDYVWAVPIFAMLGCSLACGFLLLLSIRYRLHTHHLLLTGIAINAFFGALTSFLLSRLMSEAHWVSAVYFWLMGGLNAISWGDVSILSIALILGVMICWQKFIALDLIGFGEEWSQTQGVSRIALQGACIVAVSLWIGSSVAVAGGVGFVGLMVPHLTRRVLGPTTKPLFIYSMFNGASMLMFADLLCKSLLYPTEIQLGVLTALVGGLFFFFILIKPVLKRP